jgi:CheY-like chemotaxis protein
MEKVHRKNLKALVVEDNEALAYVLSQYLEDNEVAAHYATNGRDAVELVEKNNYDFILMDIYMPVMNGIEATKRIIALKPDSVIIVSTSSCELLESERIKAAGAKICMVKPVSKERLVRAVCENLPNAA